LESLSGSGDDSLDVNGDPVYIMGVTTNFDRRQVVRWIVKEEIFFDKKRSVMDTRIIGLCPVVEDYEDPLTGIVADEKELFWIYYPDFRDILLNTKVSNFTKNNAQERSFLGVFEKRMFASRIIMESNIMNRSISDYMIGLDALLESERITEEIFNIEHDMWEY
jgi:gliding motility associated protien GldN